MPFYKAYGLSISSEIELPELCLSESVDSLDLYIRKGEVDLPKFKKTQIYRRGIRALFATEQDGASILYWENVAVFKAEKGTILTVTPLTEDPEVLSLFTVSEALGLILFQRGYFLLHASAVKVGNEAWVFMGNPGAGKSTTAAAFVKAGCKLLSDDLTAIRFDEKGNSFIIPGYPQLKIWDIAVEGLAYNRNELKPVSEGVNKFSYIDKGDFPQEDVPLKEIFFLHKARNRSALQALSPLQIPVETLKNFPLPTTLLSGEVLKTHFLQSFQCAESARMWKKRRPAGFEALEDWVGESISLQADIVPQDVG